MKKTKILISAREGKKDLVITDVGVGSVFSFVRFSGLFMLLSTSSHESAECANLNNGTHGSFNPNEEVRVIYSEVSIKAEE